MPEFVRGLERRTRSRRDFQPATGVVPRSRGDFQLATSVVPRSRGGGAIRKRRCSQEPWGFSTRNRRCPREPRAASSCKGCSPRGRHGKLHRATGVVPANQARSRGGTEWNAEGSAPSQAPVFPCQVAGSCYLPRANHRLTEARHLPRIWSVRMRLRRAAESFLEG